MLVDLWGKPLVQWTAERTAQAEGISEVIIATDDERVAEALAGLPFRVVMTRSDHPSGTDRVAEVVRTLDAVGAVNVQGDEPMIDPKVVSRIAREILSEPCDMATAVTPITSLEEFTNPNVVKAVLNGRGEALYFSRSPIPHVRDGGWDVSKPGWRHLGIYGYRTEFLKKLVELPPCDLETLEKLEQLRALHSGAVIRTIEVDDPGMGVDSPEDLKLVQQKMKAAGLTGDTV